jgi:hypothetical protein
MAQLAWKSWDDFLGSSLLGFEPSQGRAFSGLSLLWFEPSLCYWSFVDKLDKTKAAQRLQISHESVINRCTTRSAVYKSVITDINHFFLLFYFKLFFKHKFYAFEPDFRELLSNVWNDFVTSVEPQIKRTQTDSTQLKNSTQITFKS